MSVSRRLLCIVYALIAVLALIGTWGNNVAYLGGGFLETNRAFWSDTLANPASRSITVDLFYLGLAVFVWMVLEARRLGMRWVWLYLVFGMLIAISVTVPVFLILRERVLAKKEPGSVAGQLTALDGIGLMLVTVAIVAYTVLALQT
jgi:Protein of unknown function DUF2834